MQKKRHRRKLLFACETSEMKRIEKERRITFYRLHRYILMHLGQVRIAALDISRAVAIAISRTVHLSAHLLRRTYPFSSASEYSLLKASLTETRAPRSSPENPPFDGRARYPSCCCQISQKTILERKKITLNVNTENRAVKIYLFYVD